MKYCFQSWSLSSPIPQPTCVFSCVSEKSSFLLRFIFLPFFFQIYFLGSLKIWIYIMEALLRIQRLQAFYDLIFLRGIFSCCGCWCESIYGPWMPSSGGKASSSLLVTVSSLAKFTCKITSKLAADHSRALFVAKSESVKNVFYMAGHTNREAIWCFTVF